MTRQATRRLVLAAVAGAAALASMPAVLAQADAPLRVIMPFSPGSGVDVTIRAAQNALSRELKQPVVIENLPGAGGITGTSQLVTAAPDGRTIAFVSNNHVVNPSIYKKMPFDSLADITPISIVGTTPFALVVNPTKLPVNTVDIGMAQLAMHSCFETMGSRDVETFVRAVRACYESSLRFMPEGVALR